MSRSTSLAACAAVAASALVAAGPAQAEVVDSLHTHSVPYSYDVAAFDPNYCPDLPFPLHVEGTTSEQITGVLMPNGLVSYRSGIRVHETVTNTLNGKALVVDGVGRTNDASVTDNGDGTLTLVERSPGQFQYTFPTVKFHDAGLFVYTVIVDDAGTPGDPSDDEPIEFLDPSKVVGHQDTLNRDYCADLAMYLA